MIEPVAILPIIRRNENQRQVIRRVLYNYRNRAITDRQNSVTKRQFLDYFKFTIVRNPWTRAISAYSNVLRGERHQRKLGISKDTTLTEFLTQFAGKRLLRSQMEWITDFRGNVPMDFIGRFETLDEDFKTITSILDCGPIELPGKSESVKRERPYSIGPELDDLIGKIYRQEIEYFGYERPDSWDAGTRS